MCLFLTINTSLQVHVHTRAHTHMFTCIRVRAGKAHRDTYICVCTCSCTQVHTHTHAHTLSEAPQQQPAPCPSRPDSALAPGRPLLTVQRKSRDGREGARDSDFPGPRACTHVLSHLGLSALHGSPGPAGQGTPGGRSLQSGHHPWEKEGTSVLRPESMFPPRFCPRLVALGGVGTGRGADGQW